METNKIFSISSSASPESMVPPDLGIEFSDSADLRKISFGNQKSTFIVTLIWTQNQTNTRVL